MSKPDYKGLVLKLIEEWPECFGFDGYELQELCEQFGVLVPTERKHPSAWDCNCGEYEGIELIEGREDDGETMENYEFSGGHSVTCFRLHDDLKNPTSTG